MAGESKKRKILRLPAHDPKQFLNSKFNDPGSLETVFEKAAGGNKENSKTKNILKKVIHGNLVQQQSNGPIKLKRLTIQNEVEPTTQILHQFGRRNLRN